MGLIHYNAQVPATDTVLFTSTGTTTPLSKIIAWNASGTDRTLTLTIHRALSGAVETIFNANVPTGQALALVEDRLLALEEIVLDPGDTLHGLAAAATAVNVLAFE